MTQQRLRSKERKTSTSLTLKNRPLLRTEPVGRAVCSINISPLTGVKPVPIALIRSFRDTLQTKRSAHKHLSTTSPIPNRLQPARLVSLRDETVAPRFARICECADLRSCDRS